MKTLFFAIGMCLSSAALAQCDPSFMFEKLPWPKPPLEILKPYSIPVQAQAGVPFSVQYSILFGKGKNYIFCIKQIGKGKSPLKFTATNSKNEVVKCDTLENFGDDGVMLGFEADREDKYNLTLHSAQSFDGCIIFLVSFLTETQKTTHGWKMTVPTFKESSSRKLIEKDSLVKKFEIASHSSSAYGLGLEKDQLYALRIEDDVTAKHLSINVDARHGSQPKTHLVPQANGYTLFIRAKEEGLHIFKFGNSSKDKPALAFLFAAQEPPK